MNNSKSIIETLVGVIVLALCIAFIMVIYVNGNLRNRDNDRSCYFLNAFFERSDGITVGSKVMVSGVIVGRVIEQSLDKSSYNAILKISVNTDVMLPVDTSAEIISAGFLGDKYIALIPGAETEFLKNGDTIEFTQSSISLESLIGKIVFGGTEGANSSSSTDDNVKLDPIENNENNNDKIENNEENTKPNKEGNHTHLPGSLNSKIYKLPDVENSIS